MKKNSYNYRITILYHYHILSLIYFEYDVYTVDSRYVECQGEQEKVRDIQNIEVSSFIRILKKFKTLVNNLNS